jgi:ATP-dependent Clp protease ATP-binding subunit ClpA
VDIQLAKLKKRLAQQQLTLDVDKPPPRSCWPGKATTRNSARARSNAPCRNTLLNPLSMRLLEGEFKPGDKIKRGRREDADLDREI